MIYQTHMRFLASFLSWLESDQVVDNREILEI